MESPTAAHENPTAAQYDNGLPPTTPTTPTPPVTPPVTTTTTTPPVVTTTGQTSTVTSGGAPRHPAQKTVTTQHSTGLSAPIGNLPFTGSDVISLAAIAFILVVVGLSLAHMSRMDIDQPTEEEEV